MKYTVGMDIGGTKILAGLVDENKVVYKKIKVTIERKEKGWVIKKILEIIKKLIKNREIIGIGIGAPGSIKNGKILISPNLPYFNDVNIKNIIKKEFGAKTVVDNEVNCMAFGESIIKKEKNLVCITLGTGIGGGIILNGKIYHGKGSAGEIGHMSIFADGVKCKCGNYGCFEEYVGSRGFARLSKKFFDKKISPIEIENLARKGNEKAIKIYSIIGKWLGVGLANLNNIFHPNIIVIGGGIAKSGNLLLKPAKKELKRRSFLSLPKIELAKENSSIIGAAWLVLK